MGGEAEMKILTLKEYPCKAVSCILYVDDPFTKCLQAIIAFPVLTYLGYSTRVHVHLATTVHSHSLT